MSKTARQEPTTLLLASPRHTNAKERLLSYWERIRHTATPRRLALVAAGICVLTITTLTVLFFMPRTTNFSFAGQNCFVSPMLLPNLVSKKQGRTFAAEPQSTIAIAGYPLYSHTTCVTPSRAPEDGLSETISFSPLNIGFLKKNIHINTGSLPKVDYKNILAKPIAPNAPLTLPLSSADTVFEYRLQANEQTTKCTVGQIAKLVCDVAKLNLEQSTAYTLSLRRFFDGKLHKTLFSENANTVGAISLTESSIGDGQIVFDAPRHITLTFNKDIKSFNGIELAQTSGDERRNIPTTTNTTGAVMTITLGEPLPRSSTFELTTQSVSAPDGGRLPEPLKLTFSTSGGPQVKSISIGTHKVPIASNIALTFDIAVSGEQNLSEFITLEAGGKAVPAKLSREDNRVVINPDSNLPRCAALRVRVLDGLENEHGIAGGSAWSYDSRTICQETFSIGSSVQGRAITAYRFGTGNSTMVFVGTTHGDEKSSTHTLNNLIDYLEHNPSAIPAHRTVVIIPNINPDGYNASKRTNANGVDLNRNFPARTFVPASGSGERPLSEPESRILHDLIRALRPDLVIVCHSWSNRHFINYDGPAGDLARRFAALSGYPLVESRSFAATPGSLGSFVGGDLGLPILTIEWRQGCDWQAAWEDVRRAALAVIEGS